jgi:CheY-like chemotaxis protein
VITVLVVGNSSRDFASLAADDPFVEVLTASGAEEALERLARNRRIDAVLLTGVADPAGTAQAIHEEDPGAPPLFAAASAAPLARVRQLRAGTPEELLRAIAHELSADR